MTVWIEEETEASFPFDYRKLAEEVVAFTLDYEKFPYEAEVDLTLTDIPSIQELNKSHRGLDKPTDVLSFPMVTFPTAGDFTDMSGDLEDNFNPDTGEALLGDIVISVPKVYEQAEAYGHTVKREFAFLVVHSVLHLLGYDHMTPADAAFMENKQESILQAMNILR